MMSILCCCCRHRCRRNPVGNRRKMVILLAGLDNSGKTTVANCLRGEQVTNPISTVGFNIVCLKYKEFDVNIYDVGGGSQIRSIWSSYFHDVHGIIFVVDASDHSRMEEARLALESLVSSKKLLGKPLLVLANKQDVLNAFDKIDIIESWKLEKLVNTYKCFTSVEECSARSTDTTSKKIDIRIFKGYSWLTNQIIKNYTELNRRVEEDVRAENEIINAQREAWRKKQIEIRDQEVDSNVIRVKSSKASAIREVFLGNGASDAYSVPLQNGIAVPEKLFGSKKTNRVFPEIKNTCQPPALPVSTVLAATFHSSLTVKALMSPPNRTIQTHDDARSNSFIRFSPKRPRTTESCREYRGWWGLDKELDHMEMTPSHTSLGANSSRSDPSKSTTNILK